MTVKSMFGSLELNRLYKIEIAEHPLTVGPDLMYDDMPDHPPRAPGICTFSLLGGGHRVFAQFSLPEGITVLN